MSSKQLLALTILLLALAVTTLAAGTEAAGRSSSGGPKYSKPRKPEGYHERQKHGSSDRRKYDRADGHKQHRDEDYNHSTDHRSGYDHQPDYHSRQEPYSGPPGGRPYPAPGSGIDYYPDPHTGRYGSYGKECKGCPRNLHKCNGECVNLNSNAQHCGACNAPCAENQICHDKDCECDLADTNIKQCPIGGEESGIFICANTYSDQLHCGDCDSPCSGDTPYCNEGTCSDTAPDCLRRNTEGCTEDAHCCSCNCEKKGTATQGTCRGADGSECEARGITRGAKAAPAKPAAPANKP